MKDKDFLIKLFKQNKIEIVQPSKNVAEAYIQRSNESLISAKTLIKIGNLKDSVALAYYSMYHYLLAVLFRVGIKSENHAGSILLLKEIFNIDNSTIEKAKSERIDKQYYVDFEVNKLEAEGTIKTAENFLADLANFMANITEEKIAEYRRVTSDIFKEKD
jgi:uncharacterized protein (UPF0332 family)